MPPADPPSPCIAAPSTSANRAGPSPSPSAAARTRASCRHCGSRSDPAHSSKLAAPRARCSAIAIAASVLLLLLLLITLSGHAVRCNVPGPRSKWPWNRSSSTRRTSSASRMPGRSFAASCLFTHAPTETTGGDAETINLSRQRPTLGAQYSTESTTVVGSSRLRFVTSVGRNSRPRPIERVAAVIGLHSLCYCTPPSFSRLAVIALAGKAYRV